MLRKLIQHNVSTVAYLGYSRHGTCHGRHFDGSQKLLGKNSKFCQAVSWTSILRPMQL